MCLLEARMHRNIYYISLYGEREPSLSSFSWSMANCHPGGVVSVSSNSLSPTIGSLATLGARIVDPASSLLLRHISNETFV